MAGLAMQPPRDVFSTHCDKSCKRKLAHPLRFLSVRTPGLRNVGLAGRCARKQGNEGDGDRPADSLIRISSPYNQIRGKVGRSASRRQ